jgi:hypothetical protein
MSEQKFDDEALMAMHEPMKEELFQWLDKDNTPGAYHVRCVAMASAGMASMTDMMIRSGASVSDVEKVMLAMVRNVIEGAKLAYQAGRGGDC